MLKDFIKFILAILIAFSINDFASASNPYETRLRKQPTSNGKQVLVPNSKGNRMPARGYDCIINETGVYVDYMDTEEIILFEIYSIDGDLLFSCVDSTEFVNFIININEEIEIRLYTCEYVYVGSL